MPGRCASLIRLIRRRVVLGLIFALSLTYCAFSLFRSEKKNLLSLDIELDDMDPMMLNDNDDLMADDNMLPEELRASDKPLLWQVEMPDRADNTGNMDNLNENNASTQPCRNSVQGKGLIVDERGIVCSRHEVLSNGCCTIERKQALKNEETSSMGKNERYSCKTCNSQGCCTIYEYCVSCCLHPDRQILQMRGRKLGSSRMQKDGGRLRIRNQDYFQICLAVCRTSSLSVQHENTYKDPLAKHCYVPQPNSQRHRRNFNSLNNNGDSSVVVVNSSSVVMLLIHLSPEYYTFYCPLNEFHVDLFPYINMIYIESMFLTLSPTIIFVLKYYSLIIKCLKGRPKATHKRRFEAPYIPVLKIYIRIFFLQIVQDFTSDRVLRWVVIDHIAICCRVVTRNGPSRPVGFVDAGSVNEQRMEEYRVAGLHLEIHPFFDRRQVVYSVIKFVYRAIRIQRISVLIYTVYGMCSRCYEETSVFTITRFHSCPHSHYTISRTYWHVVQVLVRWMS